MAWGKRQARACDSLLGDCRGLTTTEYVLVLALVALVGAGGLRVFGSTVSRKVVCAGAALFGTGSACVGTGGADGFARPTIRPNPNRANPSGSGLNLGGGSVTPVPDGAEDPSVGLPPHSVRSGVEVAQQAGLTAEKGVPHNESIYDQYKTLHEVKSGRFDGVPPLMSEELFTRRTDSNWGEPTRGEIFSKGKDGQLAHPNDVQQGEFRDCWLMATLAEIALRDHNFLEQNLRWDAATGATQATLFVTHDQAGSSDANAWTPITRPIKELPLARMPMWAQGMFSESGDDGERWPRLYEMAFGQLYGWQAMDHGQSPALALSALTGRDTTEVRRPTGVDFAHAGNVFAEGGLVLVGTMLPDSHDELFMNGTLSAQHAYYVTAMTNASGSEFEDNGSITIGDPRQPTWRYTMTYKEAVKHMSGIVTQPRPKPAE